MGCRVACTRLKTENDESLDVTLRTSELMTLPRICEDMKRQKKTPLKRLTTGSSGRSSAADKSSANFVTDLPCDGHTTPSKRKDGRESLGLEVVKVLKLTS